MEKLQRPFYERNALIVAKELLGKQLVHHTHEGKTVGKIVEVEAYVGPDDAGSHAYQGKYTTRTAVMFGGGGHAYIYLIYGVYYCFNIVANQENFPEAVLIRALEPITGLDLMKKRCHTDQLLNLCNGPGKLCTAMGISKIQNRADLCGEAIYLLSGAAVAPESVVSTPRINIDYAGAARDYPWRFILKDNSFVSKPKNCASKKHGLP